MSEKEHKPPARDPETDGDESDAVTNEVGNLGTNGLEIIGDTEPPSVNSFEDPPCKKETRVVGLEIIGEANPPFPPSRVNSFKELAREKEKETCAGASTYGLEIVGAEDWMDNPPQPPQAYTSSPNARQLFCIPNAILVNDEIFDAEIIDDRLSQERTRDRLSQESTSDRLSLSVYPSINNYVFALVSVALVVSTVIATILGIQDKNTAKGSSLSPHETTQSTPAPITLIQVTNTSKATSLPTLEPAPKSTIPPTLAPAPKPTMSREDPQLITEDIEVNVLLRDAKFGELPNTDIRKLALEWLLHDDTMQQDALDSNLRQRFILALLAFEFRELSMSAVDVNWLSNGDECEWNGVSCDNGGKVIELRLDNKELAGSLPPEISKLEALSILDLSTNQLTGTIPSELGNLGELTWFELYHNQLRGPIPSELGNLGGLEWLGLSFNQLTGTIPPEFGNMGELTGLNLSNNQLTVTIPSELGSLEKLSKLWLGNNQLTGTIPSELSNIDYLYTSGNQLS